VAVIIAMFIVLPRFAIAHAIHTLVERPPAPALKRAPTARGNGAAIPRE
jgi:hypothetical protein